MTSYLTGRTQYVRYRGEVSTATRVYCGVPQGSVLGPFLFLLYVADVIELVKACGLIPHAFADDLLIYGHSVSADIQELVARISPIRLLGTVIQPSQSILDLGVIVDSDLSLSAHVSHITSVCFYYLHQLRLVRRSLTVDAAHALVRAMIHSRLDYCNSLLAMVYLLAKCHV